MSTNSKQLLDRLSPEKRSLLAMRLKQKRSTGEDVPTPDILEIVPAPDQRNELFPLTDLQQAYWIGRSGVFEIGTVASHSYLELEAAGLDLEQLNLALRRVIARHDMLRTVILSDGQQHILEEVPAYEITVLDLHGQPLDVVEAEIEAVRQRMSHQVLPSDQWPLFEVRATQYDDCVRLHLSLDGLILDAWSIDLILKEWGQLYLNPDSALKPLDLSFRDYVLTEIKLQDSFEFRRARAYWNDRLNTLPPAPDLPLAQNPAAIENVRFVRRHGRLDVATWQRLQERISQAGLTQPGVLLAAYAEVLALWSNTPKFTVSVPRFNRLPLHPQVNSIVGEFASFMFVEVDTSGNDNFLARARRIQEQMWRDLDHSSFSGVKFLRELAQAQEGNSLMPVIFTSLAQDGRSENGHNMSLRGNLAEVVYAINQTSQVWLDNHVSEENGAFVCDWDWVDGLFPEGMSENMFEAYMRLLENLANDSHIWQQSRAAISHLLMPPAQLERRANVNGNTAPVPDMLIQDFFAAQVAEGPNRVAIVTPGKTISYQELYDLANQWGRHLRQLGAEPNKLVAVVMEKGWEQIVAVEGILQSGAAYLPIDATVPPERLQYLLERGEVELVLTQSWLDQNLEWPENIMRLVVDLEDVSHLDTSPLQPVQNPDDLAVVIFTSGSTGLPKGVMLRHRGLVNCIRQTNETFNIGPDDKALALTALHHDMSAFDMFGILGAGGTIVIPAAWGRRDPAHWSELILQEQVTVWNSVPAMMEMLLEYAENHATVAIPQSLRLTFLGGDWIPVTLPERLHAFAERAQLVSVGGPTETTLWNIWYPIQDVEPGWTSVPYGQPIANTKYYILNEVLEDCPDWVAGEQCVSGIGLAEGYWRDAEKTDEKFLIHPRTGERIYHTGDLGRYLPDGNIEFVGRVDFQVKINGQRIELGEIEATLQRHPAIRSVIATAVGDNGRKNKNRLIAYVVPQRDEIIGEQEMRLFLLGKIPDYMVPTGFVILDELPLTANGKVDRKSLPEFVEDAPQEVEQVAAVAGTGIVAQLSQIVADILKISQVDPEADLVSLGANSIDMVRIGNQLEKNLGFRPRMDQLFRLRTVAALAKYIEPHVTEQQETLETTSVAGVDAEIRSIITSFKYLLTPEDRNAFKDSQPGIRRDVDDNPIVELARPGMDEDFLKKYSQRRSHRTYSLKSIPFEKFSGFLSCMYQGTMDGKPKYQYASPGGLYPTQIYLHVKPGRIDGIGAGVYYYHPVEHRLITMTPDVEIDRTIHIPFINTPIFDEAAFSIFFITQLSAIAPSYGEQSIHFATLEAGIMAHHMEMSAPEFSIGVCQIGSVDFDRIRSLFKLDKTHFVVHTSLGGRIDEERSSEDIGAYASLGNSGKAAKTLQRLKGLSKDEVRALLEANKAAKQGENGK